MTRDDGWEQFDRFAKAGYPPPADDIIAGAFEEWFTALERYETATVADAVTRMIRTRASRFWPTVAETRDAVLALAAGARRDASCHVCHGSGWVEAPPYRANGGHVYEGVVRCSACGIPAPKVDHLVGTQTPLTGAELRAWADRAASVPISLPELLAQIDAMKGRIKLMPTPRRRAFAEE